VQKLGRIHFRHLLCVQPRALRAARQDGQRPETLFITCSDRASCRISSPPPHPVSSSSCETSETLSPRRISIPVSRRRSNTRSRCPRPRHCLRPHELRRHRRHSSPRVGVACVPVARRVVAHPEAHRRALRLPDRESRMTAAQKRPRAAENLRCGPVARLDAGAPKMSAWVRKSRPATFDYDPLSELPVQLGGTNDRESRS
jgi:hypothetical protein